MWFKKNDKDGYKTASWEVKALALEGELKFLKSRLRGIQDRAFEVKKNEAYYVVQTASGRFSKVMLPYIGEK